MNTRTLRLTPDAKGLARAAELLTQSALVSFPTETVYGLGADARDGTAVARIYEAKGRPSFNPLIVHIADVSQALDYVRWNNLASKLADAFWPGPLTLVLPLKQDHGLSSLVTAGLDTVALRVPAHPTARSLLKAFGGPVAAPSANPSGKISPTSADHVVAGLEGRIEAVVDDGPCSVGVESTIIGISGAATAVLLRSGGVPREAIESVLGSPLSDPQSAAVTAPGQLASHYAPGASVRLNASQALNDEVMLGFGAVPCDLNLSPDADLQEAAAHLFEYLHRLDALGRPIAVSPVPDHGLGSAINDRLRRAAAPR
ncbi:Sua5/YciO/YrdC family protein [Sulfitobacter noctilucicola]|uniref:Threonylcarbamoyl-AMP synthase n=1 Tax=Sulfitobacter noctilucicola TaxID=1342301 RepID=A0A7W6Q2S8_9RHOB|nr:L-threonylcarbamoyladenylate synthase [Sulfitobacter noctilucicola]KIN62106.1 Sua5/YciO/YrdC family protein [Sulfitobacter noctilucicola]MBB4173375.1 L-threonylcarbamoyladenylate synthase [Sulfitobacter noctilucicola]